MALIKLNLNSNFKLADEGEQVLEITKAECTPSGKPNCLKVTFKAENGGNINSRYDFTDDTSLWAMGMLISKALEMNDGEEFDTKKDTPRLVGKKLIGEVVHRKGNKPNDKGELPTFANVKKIISLVNEETGEVVVSDKSPRNMITEEDDLD